MQCRDQESTTSDEINAVIDGILEEDRQERSARDRKRKLNVSRRCEELQERDRPKKRNCPKVCHTRHIGVNQSKRFSVRVMEAIRAIERQSETGCATACEIVDYCKCNFESDGDVEAQVRTALKRTSCHGLIKIEGNDSYSLVGPLACQLTKTQKSNVSKSMRSKSRCSDKRARSSSPSRRKLPSVFRPRNARSSDTELSIPTSVEEDINRERAQREITNVQRNEASRNTRIDGTCEQRVSSPRKCDDGLNFNATTADQQESLISPRRGTPRQRSVHPLKNHAFARPSPAREENELVDATENLDINFVDDSDDESIEIPVEEQQQPHVQNPIVEEEEEEEDVASDDSALHEIRGQNDVRPAAMIDGNDRDRELRRWIRNCRKECVKRAARR